MPARAALGQGSSKFFYLVFLFCCLSPLCLPSFCNVMGVTHFVCSVIEYVLCVRMSSQVIINSQPV